MVNSKYHKLMRRKRSDCLTKEAVNKIHSFYRSPPPIVLRERPGRRFKGQFLMFLSQREAFQLFLKENPSLPCQLHFISRLSPQYILKYSKLFHFICQCPYCVTVEIILDAVNRRISRSNSDTHVKKKL